MVYWFPSAPHNHFRMFQLSFNQYCTEIVKIVKVQLFQNFKSVLKKMVVNAFLSTNSLMLIFFFDDTIYDLMYLLEK